MSNSQPCAVPFVQGSKNFHTIKGQLNLRKCLTFRQKKTRKLSVRRSDLIGEFSSKPRQNEMNQKKRKKKEEKKKKKRKLSLRLN